MSMLREIPRYGFQSFIQEPQEGTIPQAFSEEVAAKVHTFHQQLPGYSATRLAALKGLAKTWGVGGIFVKDESTRFDLKAFKVLGGSYAVARLVSKKLGLHLEETDYRHLVSNEARAKIGRMTFATATDGNHGRGIAWAAEQFGQEAMSYMPKGAAPSRVQNIRSHGAKVEVTELNYDDAVRLACRNAKEEGWHLTQDTAWEGYEEIPLWIMQGYMTMAKEAEVLTAFFLEASFLGVMLFGWNRVSPKMHFAATLMVVFGTLVSAFWILSATSLKCRVADSWKVEVCHPGGFYPYGNLL